MNGSGSLAALSVAVVAMGCATARPHVSRAIYEAGPHYVKLVELRGAAGEPELTFDHPVDFVADDFRYILGTVTASTRGRGGWSKPAPVFGPGARNHLAPHLARAFNEAGHTEYVAFKVTAKVPGFLLPKFEVTAGTAFVRDGEFHLQLEHVGTRADEVERITYHPKRSELRRTVRLEPGEDMRRMADPESGRLYNHWIAADWATLQAKLTAWRAAVARRAAARERRREITDAPAPRRGPQWEAYQEAGAVTDEGRFSTDDATTGAVHETVEERLRHLEALRQQGLITDAEYNRKHREILDEL